MLITSVESGVLEGGSWELEKVGVCYRVAIKLQDGEGVTEVCFWFDDLYDEVIDLCKTLGCVPEGLLFECISKHLKD